MAQPDRARPLVFTTDTPFVHDPVMAYEDGLYHAYYTGHHIGHMSSPDRRTWTVHREGLLPRMSRWTSDSVPGFKHHVWAPDVIRWNGRWYMAYSCSTFGKNTSAIGLLSNARLADKDSWRDEGCIIASKGGRDNWNAIDPNFVVDGKGQLWLSFGSFWDGIQLVRLDSTMHVAYGEKPRTIARRFAFNTRDVPESEGGPAKVTPGNYSPNAGQNAIEAPFIFEHDGWYYLFVSWDYCCLGMKSTYRVVVGRSRTVEGPYLDNRGIDMVDGGGYPVLEGDKKEFEAAGHCAVYHLGTAGDVFLCHGYAIDKGGMSVLVQRPIRWIDGWPSLAE